jgi:hypothetical protein
MASYLKEIVVYHKPSKLLMVTDTAVNFSAKEFHGIPYYPIVTVAFINDAYNKLGVPRYFRFLANKAETKENLDQISKWDTRGIITAHGPPVISENAIAQWCLEWKKRL